MPAAAADLLRGIVVDAASGLPVSGATIVPDHGNGSARTGADGRFTLGLEPGTYRLRVGAAGFQSSLSDTILIDAQAREVTLALQRERTATAHIIGRTRTTAAGSLSRATTTTQTIAVSDLEARGVERAGDALRALPAVTNGITGDTAALGDDIPLEIRGIGTLETTTLFDGHPVASGFPGGYNFQLSPLAPFRDVGVTYGSGSNVLGTSAIAGAFTLRTLEPTLERQFSVEQGYGTFNKSTTTLRTTGTQGRLGYAFAYGAAGLDGPQRHNRMYQPAAAFDVSATSPAVRALGVYDDDGSTNAHSALAKVRYDVGRGNALVGTLVSAGYYEDKTGNGDGDYLEAAPAAAFGRQSVGTKGCASGMVPVFTGAGKRGGTGPDGTPDGGAPCLPLDAYVAAVSGYQGAGPSFQTVGLLDAQLGFEHTGRNDLGRLLVFGNRYGIFRSRQYQLPFKATVGDNFSVADQRESEGGFTLSEDVQGRIHGVGFSYAYLNEAFALARDTPSGHAFGGPVVHTATLALRDVYHVPGSAFSLFGDVALQSASATNTTALDPRVTAVQRLGNRALVRFSAGATTTQPSGDMLGQPFVPRSLVAAGGGGGITCGGLNSIGSVPSSALHPERGVDEELGYAQAYGTESDVQVAIHNVNVYNKLYKTTIPLAATGGGFVDPTFLQQQIDAISHAGCPNPAGLVGVTGTFNVGAMRARGFVLSGHHRFDARTGLDYAWQLDGTSIVAVPDALLRSNLKLIPGAQLPGLPAHSLDAGLAHRTGVIDVRYGYHWVSDNNTKRLPAYTWSDLAIGAPLGRARLSLSVDNLFNQWSDTRGLLYEGQPYALNAYAQPSAYAPYTGAAASERFGLPPRMLYLNYALRIR